ADYAGCKDSFKSTSSGAQFLGEKLLTDYGYIFKKIPIYCDSKSAIAISCKPVQHSRTKHIAVWIRLKRDKSEQKRIKTGQKREAWRSSEKSRAVSVDRARKIEENAKRMVKNANTIEKLLEF
nr:hypothetical protein [Tanacetum cinerariifolium]